MKQFLMSSLEVIVLPSDNGSIATAGWFIGMILALAFLILLLPAKATLMKADSMNILSRKYARQDE